MLRRGAAVILLLTAGVTSVQGYLRAYGVEPVKASWSGWTERNGYVAQTITCNFDSLVYGGFWHHALDFPAISPVIL